MALSLNEYQTAALASASYPSLGHNMVYPSLGMVGEAGEVAEKVKKYWRNHGVTDASGLTAGQRQELGKEIGDVMWYCAALAWELGLKLDEIGQGNIDKLTDRHKRGVIKSEGDNR
jgi:NTP pyrophosphatase (non-canonical NTP hydrolase)